MKFPSLYFNWLQKDNPAGTVDRFPELRNKFETTVPGLYCIGDLTGIPLIKLAAESGYELIENLAADESFKKERQRNKNREILDLVIIGAGPAGVSACLHAQELGFKHVLVESSRKFNTIINFPAGKPIYVTPADPPMKSALKFSEGTKETLLKQLDEDIAGKPLPIREGEMVRRIVKEADRFTVETAKGSFNALRVIVAIGKTGNARSLSVAGEKLPKVFTRLIDPGEHYDQDILVVGGGDSAVEAAAALAKAGNRVTLSYRKSALSRPKEQNLAAFDHYVKQGAITPMFESSVKEIRETDVIITTRQGEKTVPNHAIFALIGSEIPIEFFKRSNIRMEGEKHFTDRVKAAALLLFAAVLYFGKTAPALKISGWQGFLEVPAKLLGKPWLKLLSGMAAWISVMALALCVVYLIGHFFTNRNRYFTSPWNHFKYAYYLSMAALFSYLYVAYKLLGTRPLFNSMGQWYTVMYSLTIVLFGLRRIAVKPTGYIRRQTIMLMAIQIIPLLILPLFIIPWLAQQGLLSDWVLANVFPGGSYWRAFGFILAWPLFIHNLATGQPTLFWLFVALAQTFVIIPWIVVRWGKGAYCGWICSCGALAETLGDEYRAQAPHGPTPKKMENLGQFVLWFAVAVTAIALLAGSRGTPLSKIASDLYAVIVDIVFAGVLGVGVYFFLSGRFWCRFLCPLAALMHLYARFSLYRIFADKKRCISCNICTKVCHMGIDVMGYANKGIPMNDVQCVRCSACVVNCPMQVLTFGRLAKIDLDNVEYKDRHVPLTPGWPSGLPEAEINMLIDEERKKHPIGVN